MGRRHSQQRRLINWPRALIRRVQEGWRSWIVEQTSGQIDMMSSLVACKFRYPVVRTGSVLVRSVEAVQLLERMPKFSKDGVVHGTGPLQIPRCWS